MALAAGNVHAETGSGVSDAQLMGRQNRQCKNNMMTFQNKSNTVRTEQLGPGSQLQKLEVPELRRMDNEKDAIMAIFQRLDKRGLLVDSYTYVEVLQRISKIKKNLDVAKYAHNHILNSGVEPNIYGVNKLLKMYMDCGSVEDARDIYCRIVEKNVVTWTIMIGGYARNGLGEDDFEVFGQISQMRILLQSILKTCDTLKALDRGKQIHALINTNGLESDIHVSTSLLKMYAECGSLEDAQKVFDKMVNRNVVSWNVIIGGYAEIGDEEKAYRLFLQMQQECVDPNAITYMSILNPSARVDAL